MKLAATWREFRRRQREERHELEALLAANGIFVEPGTPIGVLRRMASPFS